MMHEAEYYTTTAKGVRCDLCPHGCNLAEGQHGLCRSRVNHGGKLYSAVYGRPCSIAIDPVEKKPLYHFHPGTKCLSIACTGCNLACRFCQNYEISQVSPDEVEDTDLPPEKVVELCISHHLKSIAYTYTEPLTYYEYVRDCARLAHEHGLLNILVSAGYINQKPLEAIAPYIDAANIDLKSFSDDIYRRVSNATLKPVLDTLLTLKRAGVWVEITNLIVPTVNDDMKMIGEMCCWLVDNGFAENPLHLSRFFPMYKMSQLQPTPISTMRQAQQIATDAGIKWVYLGNV
jgi:pyruvate formate lyase activating enzyme